MAKNTTNHRTVSLKQASRLILKAFNLKNKKGKSIPKVPMLWGPPGVGKSEIIQEIADNGALGNAMVIDIRLSLMEPTDIRGMPYYHPTDNTMKWAPSEEFPTPELASQYDHIILFLDEIASAPPSVQAAAYQLILNRRVGPYVLPENVRVVAAGNRDGDGGTFRMPNALKNRIKHLEIAAEYESWVEWAMMNDVHSDVIGYISYAKGDLMKYDPRGTDRAFATPRTWTFVSDYLNDDEPQSEDDLFECVAGLIGEGVGQSFMAQRKHAKDMPNPSDILSGKIKDLKTKEISAMYSLTVNLCRELQEASEKFGEKDSTKFHKMADCFFSYMMKNFPSDMCVMGARTALFQYELLLDPTELETFDEFHKRFGKAVSKAIANG